MAETMKYSDLGKHIRKLYDKKHGEGEFAKLQKEEKARVINIFLEKEEVA